jgi:glutamate 5-kinase
MSEVNEIVVVKYGSSTVANGQGINTGQLNAYAERLAHLAERKRLLVVSSGSVAVGRSIWNANRSASAPCSLEKLASLGSAGMAVAWHNALNLRGILAGQILVTHQEIDDRKEGSRLTSLLREYLEAGDVPVINENDALSNAELAKLKYGGDNDGLASHIARRMNAGRLVPLTNTEGLLDDDGSVMKKITEYNTPFAVEMAGEPEDMGRGGMRSKVDAALAAARVGIQAHIASADVDLEAVLAGRLGTTFAPQNPRT